MYQRLVLAEARVNVPLARAVDQYKPSLARRPQAHSRASSADTRRPKAEDGNETLGVRKRDGVPRPPPTRVRRLATAKQNVCCIVKTPSDPLPSSEAPKEGADDAE
jgi:hypothetical protein